MASKITETLRWNKLTARFSFMEVTVGDQTIMPFARALEDGSIEALIKECADELHGGDTAPVIKQLIENCQSKICLDKQRTVKNSTQVQSEKAVTMFKEFLFELRSKDPRTKLSKGQGGKAKWNASYEELDSITDVKVLKSYVDCMASHKAKDLAYKELTDEDKEFMERYAYARKLLSNMKAEAKNVSVSDNLLSKLAKGGKATLSAAEAKELFDLLAAQSK